MYLIQILFFTGISVLCASAALAVEVELPDNAGKVDMTDGVITVPAGTKIPDGEYEVRVDDKNVLVVFSGNKGTLKE